MNTSLLLQHRKPLKGCRRMTTLNNFVIQLNLALDKDETENTFLQFYIRFASFKHAIRTLGTCNPLWRSYMYLYLLLGQIKIYR